MKLNEWEKAIADNVIDDCFIDDFLSYDSGHWYDVISNVAYGHSNCCDNDVIEWLKSNIDEFENYINEYGYDTNKSLYDNIRKVQYETFNAIMNEYVVEIVQYYIINMLIEKGYTEIPEQLEQEIEWIDLTDVCNNDFIEDTVDQVEEWIEEYHLDCTLENVKRLSDRLGYKEFKNCIDNDDIYKRIDEMNISRETHYDDNDIIGGYKSYTIYGYTTIELKRGLNYVTPVDVVERLTFEEWNNEEKIYECCSSEYIGISAHEYSILNESGEN